MIRMTRWTAVVLLAVAPAVLAVKPVEVKHSTVEDFASGDAKDVLIWSSGITLGRSSETIMEQAKDVAMVSAITSDKEGNAYVGTAPKGKVLKIDLDGNATELANLEGSLVSDLKLEGSHLLAATAGGKCGLFRIDLPGRPDAKPAVKTLWQAPANTSIWATVKVGDTFYIATGGEGKIYVLPLNGKAEVVFEAKQKIIQSLVASGDKLIAGTGDEGLVYSIDPKAKTSRVLFDAPEQSIPALVADAEGNIYVAATNPEEAAGPMHAPAVPDLHSLTPPGKNSGEEGSPGEGDDSKSDAADDEGGPSEARGNHSLGAHGSTQPSPLSMMSHLGKLGKGKPAETERETGHTIYRINKEGFVQSLARLDDTILDMALTGSKEFPMLLVSTGNEGKVYMVNVAKRECALMASLDPKQVTVLTVEDDGAILAGTANPATVEEFTGDLAEEGTFLSKAVDAPQIARWGQIRLEGQTSNRGQATVATRTGNVEEPADDTWSGWSAEIPLSDNWAPIASPPGRYLQYRLTFKPVDKKSGTVKSVQLLYQVENLPPEIKSVQIEPQESSEPSHGGPGGKDEAKKPQSYRKISIEASDANGDDLKYDIFIRRAGRDVWLHVGKNLTESDFVWNTLTVPDGRYDVRVQASDSPDNPPATALSATKFDQTVVDNTPPILTDVVAKVDDKGQVELSGLVRDGLSRIAKVEYLIDSGEKATMASPVDGMFDSPQEKFTAAINNLGPGAHLITVRASDEYGNVGFGMVDVTISK